MARGSVDPAGIDARLQRKCTVAHQNKYDMLQFHITDGRDWLKFAWSEYFKWYAAFLTLNLVALAYYIDHATGAYRKILGYMFSIINPLSIALALIVYLWSRRVHANIQNTVFRNYSTDSG